MLEKITDLFLEHFETHLTCFDSLSVFFKLCYFSEKIAIYLKSYGLLGVFIEQFEKLIVQVLREHENSERQQFMNEALRNSFQDYKDFYLNLNKYIQNINSQPNNEILLINKEQAQETIDNNQIHQIDQGIIEPHNHPTIAGSEQSSFSIPNNVNNNRNSLGGINSTIHALSKSIKIPILNLPSALTENITTISRSTRRAGDPYKSFTTNSNRFSNNGIGSSSIDSAIKEGPYNFNHNEHNISYYDAENSYLYEDNNYKLVSYVSAQDKMKTLANQLGEYCLTIDLGCLLAQKRKLQLDQVASMTIFQGNIKLFKYD